MERETEVADAPRFLHLQQEIDNAHLLRLLPALAVDGVKQVKIHVIRLQRGQLTLEDLFRVVQRLDDAHRHLRRQIKRVARIALHRAPQKRFAGVLMVKIRRVVIRHARLVRRIQHRRRARLIDFALRRQRKTHAAKTQTRDAHAQLIQSAVFHGRSSCMPTALSQIERTDGQRPPLRLFPISHCYCEAIEDMGSPENPGFWQGLGRSPKRPHPISNSPREPRNSSADARRPGKPPALSCPSPDGRSCGTPTSSFRPSQRLAAFPDS